MFALLLSGGESPEPIRTYRLGFTPFPYDISQAAIDYVYTAIGNDADIIAHHFDEGIPWPEALAGSAYNQNVLDDWDQRKSKTPSGHKIYVAIGGPEWAIVWRDTGVYDENGVSRPALDLWRDALDREHVAATGN